MANARWKLIAYSLVFLAFYAFNVSAQTSLFYDDFTSTRYFAPNPEGKECATYYSSGGFLFRNISRQAVSCYYGFLRAGFFPAGVTIQIKATLINSNINSFYGILFGGSDADFSNAYAD